MSSSSDAAARRKAKREMSENIKLLLETPMGSGPVTDIEDVDSLQELADRNVTVSTRILMKKAVAAMKGDDKAAQFLFEYGGLKPVEEKHVTFEAPTFIDDLTEMDMRPPMYRSKEKPMIDITPEPEALPAPKKKEMPPKNESKSEGISRPTRTIQANPIMGAQISSRPQSHADLPDWIDSI